MSCAVNFCRTISSDVLYDILFTDVPSRFGDYVLKNNHLHIHVFQTHWYDHHIPQSNQWRTYRGKGEGTVPSLPLDSESNKDGKSEYYIQKYRHANKRFIFSSQKRKQTKQARIRKKIQRVGVKSRKFQGAIFFLPGAGQIRIHFLMQELGWQLARRSNMTRINPVTACTYMSSSKVHLYHTRPNFSFYISHFLPYLYSRKS